ncbi:MAG: branched-chain amino acid ABC transporter substrate-binding protein [Actinomycetes bacterium]
MKKSTRLGVIAASAALVVSGLTTVAAPASAASCSGAIGIMAPLTGGVAFVGKEQQAFAQLAVADYNAKNGTTFTTKDYDTQLDAAQASTQAPNILANKEVLGVMGPAGSQEVLAIGGLLGANNLALVSPSATRTNLTAGTYPNFFRPIPNDGLQGPGDATYMAKNLKAKEVTVIEEKTAYGTGLAQAVVSTLKTLKVKVTNIAVNEKGADYAAVVTRISKTTNVVFVTFQDAAKSEQVAQELIKQKKKAIVFGSDGSDQPTFKTPGTLVSGFAPDVTTIAAASAVVAAYKEKYKADVTTFGPPAYVAAQVIVEAAGRACAAGKPNDRAAVLEEIRKTNIKQTIMGSPLQFTANGDVKGGRFYIFQTQADGKRKTIA